MSTVFAEDRTVAKAQQIVRGLRDRVTRLDDNGVDPLFCCARSHNGWQDRPVSDAQLYELYDIVRCGPTANKGQPARITFLCSAEAKADAAFFVGTGVKSNFVCAIGYGDETAIFGRLPRLGFDQACKIL